jgi:negative regulator of sigma-B (phosphoserine phosphatase)
MVTVETGEACRPRAGEVISGDRIGIWQDDVSTLVTVIDGLGSGQLAAEASCRALACVEANRTLPLAGILPRCHEVTQDTRGVVMALARIEHAREQLTFVGVGNIGFSASSRQQMYPISQNGLVGHRLPTLLEFRFDCAPGDLIVLYSDGVSSQFVRQGGLSVLDRALPQELAQEIVQQFGKQDDDVAVAALKVTKGQKMTESRALVWS